MFGLLITAIVFFCFAMGFLIGSLIVIAVRINLEDRAATRRMLATQRLNGSILLHEEPQGPVGRGVRRLLVGQRNGPREPSRDEWGREEWRRGR
jgi:hypothetical protein